MEIDVTSARFGSFALTAGGYESFYAKAHHPSEPLGFWIRYTVHKQPRARPVGSLWVTLFDPDGPIATKVTTEDLTSGDDAWIRIGGSTFTDGAIEGETGDASWDLRFRSEDGPLLHLPKGWMYRRRLPRTKPVSPAPAAVFDGTVRLADRTLNAEGWLGMVGHNWGAEHAQRWMWLHGVGFEGRARSTWIDVVLGRIKLGPTTTPWIANGVLSLDGVRHRLGGIERARATKVKERPDGCELVLPGDGITVGCIAGAPRERFVCWRYADPDGSEHHVANCSIADLALRIDHGGTLTELKVAGGAAYELGMRETDHGLSVQPFGDG